MATDYYTGDYHFNGNMTPSFANQTFAIPQNYGNTRTTPMPNFNQSVYGQNNYTPLQPYNMNQMNQNYPNPSSFLPAYGQMGDVNQNQFAQQHRMNQNAQFQQKTKNNNEDLTPLEIRGGVMITNCNCAKKNGLQDHCSRSSCRIENAIKRQRQAKLFQDYPTKDNALSSALSPAEDANNIMINPAYEGFNANQMVPSNAQAVPYNYGM